jgi:hypothetical protein
MAKRYYGDEFYAGMAGSKKQQRADASMIQKDMSAIANMPQNVVMKEYPQVDYAYYDLNDTITGIDYQMKADMKGKKKGPMPEKY